MKTSKFESDREVVNLLNCLLRSYSEGGLNDVMNIYKGIKKDPKIGSFNYTFNLNDVDGNNVYFFINHKNDEFTVRATHGEFIILKNNEEIRRLERVLNIIGAGDFL